MSDIPFRLTVSWAFSLLSSPFREKSLTSIARETSCTCLVFYVWTSHSLCLSVIFCKMNQCWFFRVNNPSSPNFGDGRNWCPSPCNLNAWIWSLFLAPTVPVTFALFISLSFLIYGLGLITISLSEYCYEN